MYHGLLWKGKHFTTLQPVIAIWLLNESLFPTLQVSHLPFEVLNREHGVVFTNHLQIHLLQLPDWQMTDDSYDELDRWMYLFKEGEELDVAHPPAILQTREMMQAMQVLQRFAENEREYLLYQKRLDAERVENTWKGEIQRLMAEVEQERKEKEQERKEKEQERKEKERLLALLKQAGIDPTQQR